jgi:hypothetical protein
VFQNHNSVELSGASREPWLAHGAVAALIRAETDSGLLPTTLRNLAHSDLPPVPPTFDEVGPEVERIEGVHLLGLFSLLPQPFHGDPATLVRRILDLLTEPAQP